MAEDKVFVLVFFAFAVLAIGGFNGCNYVDKVTVREATRQQEETKREALKAGYCQVEALGSAYLRWVKCDAIASAVSPEAGR